MAGSACSVIFPSILKDAFSVCIIPSDLTSLRILLEYIQQEYHRSPEEPWHKIERDLTAALCQERTSNHAININDGLVKPQRS